MKKWYLAAFALVALTGVESKIIECPRFEQLSQHIDASTLILLDIDDTLLIPTQMLGSDEWFMHRLRTHKENGEEPQKALQKTLAEWEGVRHLTKMDIVEEGTERCIRALQDKRHLIMGFSTQEMSLNNRTAHQLQELGIDLKRSSPSKSDHYFELDGQGVLFRNGILSTSGRHKGKALFQFCDAIGLSPKKIVFINDKASHLAEVEAMAESRGIEFIGLRYGFSDSKKQSFRSDVADFQFSNSSFSQILSDAEAFEKIYPFHLNGTQKD